MDVFGLPLISYKNLLGMFEEFFPHPPFRDKGSFFWLVGVSTSW